MTKVGGDKASGDKPSGDKPADKPGPDSPGPVRDHANRAERRECGEGGSSGGGGGEGLFGTKGEFMPARDAAREMDEDLQKRAEARRQEGNELWYRQLKTALEGPG